MWFSWYKKGEDISQGGSVKTRKKEYTEELYKGDDESTLIVCKEKDLVIDVELYWVISEMVKEKTYNTDYIPIELLKASDDILQ